ncbi:Glycerophosphodiester phosphodiesterase domain-containing protein [Chytriomyces sp. MP71]|nr:Glycerophosphodiester phosphodiesterase domain-containing protein [Chytriomyces sp. MP71]
MGEIDPKGGRVSVPLYSTQPATNNRFLGTFTFEYIVTTPLSHPLRNLPTKTAFEWAPNGKTTLVGHRGLGMNLDAQQKCGQVLQLGENTIASFAKAHELGAHFVEFDTQVSKDGVVLLYHDNVLDETGFHVEINDLTEQEFRALKPKFAVSAREYPETIDRATTLRRARSTGNLVALAPLPSEITGTKKAKRPWKGNYVGCIQEPFTTLKEALQTLPTSLGFNIEIKYPLPDEIEREGLKSFEANRFVDAILNTVLDHAGDERAIIFSCFNAEAARMAKLKQSRYPVLFLTMGGTHETIDTRLNSVQAAARFASRFGLDGIVTSAAPVLADLALIARAKEVMRGGRALVLTYGGLNCVKGNAKRLMWAGLDGIIVDTVRQVREELDAAGR